MHKLLCKVSLERNGKILSAYIAVPVNHTVDSSGYLDYARDFIEKCISQYETRYNEMFNDDISTDLLSLEILTTALLEL